jgi:phosphotransferase system enzyme I (PtsI)
MSKRITGIAASPGIAIAKAYRLEDTAYSPAFSTVADAKGEITRFRQCVEQAIQQLDGIRERTAERLGASKAEIFESHMLLLEDPEFIDVIIDKINQTGTNAEYALHEVSNEFIDMLQAMDNELLRERATDLRDVTGRVMSLLRGERHTALSGITEESIIICDDLTPSDTAQLNLNYVKGFITRMGSRTSHSAIMARSLGIPAIVGAGADLDAVETGVTLVLDAVEGLVFIDPNEEELTGCNAKQEQYARRQIELRKLRDQPTITKDGATVRIAVNIGGVEDVQTALDSGAEGIGLFRTEFLFMGRSSLPSEDEQFQVYKYVLEGMDGKPVVIRTLDIGGDKELPYLQLPEESNPFLGVRAIRLCLELRDMFRTQLRALLRASRYGQLKIMFPMIAVLEELLEAKRLLQEEKERLIQAGEIVAEHIAVGMMIEVPAAALAAPALAKEADFFSIGTNDLIQYTMAADRMNESLAYLYQPCHPSVLRLVQMVICAAEQEGIHVGMCGEMAADETALPLLLGLGLHEFSMSAATVLRSREIISGLDRKEWTIHASRVLSLSGQNEVKQYVTNLIKE